MTTKDNSSTTLLSVFYPDQLRRLWKDGKRDWSVYSKDLFKQSYDFVEVQHRQK